MNEYSSDTKKVAAKLAGMTDACANVHDDERDAPYDMSIHSNPDHRAWAKLYIETWPNGCSDEETMATWFANAMMAKADYMQQDSQQEWEGLEVGAKVTIKKELESDSRIADFAGREVTITSVFMIGGRVAFSFWHSTLGLGAAASAAIKPEQKPDEREKEEKLVSELSAILSDALETPLKPKGVIRALLTKAEQLGYQITQGGGDE